MKTKSSDENAAQRERERHTKQEICITGRIKKGLNMPEIKNQIV